VTRCGRGVADLRCYFFFSSRRRHTRSKRDWSSDVCSSDLSPLADFGYDVSDYTAVDPQLGSLEDFDQLVAAAHDRGLRVLLDLIPCHTSIEHAWFHEHPDWYIWSPVDGPPNNWVSSFGGPAWSRDEQTGRWY